ncbi:hypothetical protein V2A60_004510 [Cordyceps javanica]
MTHRAIFSLPPELRVMICRSADFRDLFNLALSYKNISYHATEVLFEMDAATRNSSAILWAASASGTSIDYAQLAVSILRRSIKCGGDVNARHYDSNATSNIKAYSIRLWNFLKIGRFKKDLNRATQLQSFAERNGVQDQCWFPLLPAMFRHSFHVAALLLRSGHPCYLAIDQKYLFLPPLRETPRIDTAYTLHHLLVDESFFPDRHGALFQQFHADIALPASASRISPLMKAIQKGNEAAAKVLLSFPQNLDALSALGWPVISYAVEGVWTLLTPRERDWSASMVKTLLENGAGVNNGGPSSPLQLAVTSLLNDKIIVDAGHTKRMRQVIQALLNYGADVNVRTPSGNSLGQYFFLKMQKVEDPGRKMLGSVFLEFLQHGMHVNDLFTDGSSLLGKTLASNTISSKLVVAMLEQGAKPASHECDYVLNLWLNKDKHMSKELENHLHHLAPMFSQFEVDRAYSEIVKGDEVKQLKTLGKWRQPNKSSMLLGTALRYRHACRTELYEYPFDPAWQNSSGQGYAHIIIEEVGKGVYTERQAIEEMTRLIEKGVHLGHRDHEGMTVVQRLTQVQEAMEGNDPLAKLERLLTRSRLKETDNEV